MTQFDVDVVIPLYNKKDKVIRCLKSVVLQTKLPNKIIVVDDGSEDGSTDIVSEFCFSGRDKKGLIKFVSQEIEGFQPLGTSVLAYQRRDILLFWMPMIIGSPLSLKKWNS